MANYLTPDGPNRCTLRIIQISKLAVRKIRQYHYGHLACSSIHTTPMCFCLTGEIEPITFGS